MSYQSTSCQSTIWPVYNLGVGITRREFGKTVLSLAPAISLGRAASIQEERVYSEEQHAMAVARAFPSAVVCGNTVRLTHASLAARALAWDRFNASVAWQDLARGSKVELLGLRLV